MYWVIAYIVSAPNPARNYLCANHSIETQAIIPGILIFSSI